MDKRSAWFAAVLAALTAPAAVAGDPMDAAVANGAAVAAAIASPDRPKADVEQDARRRPAELLAFLGVLPGMRAIDVFSAGGYYTELLARVVGVKGQVVAYNNPPYAKFAEQAIAERYAGGRLGNVLQVTTDIGALDLPPARFDGAMFVMSYHDLYWRPADGSWPPTDPAVLLARIFAALKPGGVVVVQDHVANPGGEPTEVATKLHRIDPAVVRRDFEKAGFAFDAESHVLAHAGDDHTKLVFDPAVRGQTDQFVYRFRKPAP